MVQRLTNITAQPAIAPGKRPYFSNLNGPVAYKLTSCSLTFYTFFEKSAMYFSLPKIFVAN